MTTQQDISRSATRPQFYEAPDVRRVGEWMRDQGLIDATISDEIASYSTMNNMRFGEAAVSLGHVQQADLDRALAAQFDALPSGAVANDPRMVFEHDDQQGAKAFCSLRNILALRWFKHEQGARTLTIVAPREFEGQAAVCANLAIAFAQVGFRTLLIDADMRNPVLHSLFMLDDRVGLSGYLAGRSEEAALYKISSVPNLKVIPAGGTPPNPQELLLRGRLHELLRHDEQEFEVILINAPAASVATDYLLIGAESGGILIAAAEGETRVSETSELVRQCRAFGIRLVGSTLVAK